MQLMNKELTLNDLYSFIEPTDLSLFIPRNDFYSVFNNWMSVRDYMNNFYDKLFMFIPSFPKENIKDFARQHGGISFISHDEGKYDFRFNPMEFFYGLFNYFGLHSEKCYINLDTEEGKDLLKNEILKYIEFYRTDLNHVENPKDYIISKVMDELEINIDKIIAVYNTSLYSLIRTYTKIDNMFLYLAYISLIQYQKTKDETYLLFPYQYNQTLLPVHESKELETTYVGNEYISVVDYKNKYSSLYDPKLNVTNPRRKFKTIINETN